MSSFFEKLFGIGEPSAERPVNSTDKGVERLYIGFARPTPWLRLHIAHNYGITGEYFVVQILNRALPKPHWEDFSPRFGTENEALNYLTCMLRPHAENGKCRIAFLESLMRHARKNKVESLYYYVRDMFDYFESTHVDDRRTVEIQFISQMDDMGDEYFDCIYGVKEEIFVDKNLSDKFKLEIRPLFGQERGDGRSYFHIGSNCEEPLRLWLKFELDNIDIHNMPNYSGEDA